VEKGSAYTDPTQIREELRYCLSLCQAYQWPVIDVTGKAVEEMASEVMNLVLPPSPGAAGKL
jgi:regulator of PEP synthase PpsR (kinase-PPPase family)